MDTPQIIHLDNGAHDSREAGVCLLEAVAWLAREPHSDHPTCTSTVIGAFGRRWNDGLPDADLDRLLLPLVGELVGTGPLTDEQEHALSLRVLDWYVRHWLPTWLDLVPSLHEHADRLRGLDPVDGANARTVGVVVRSATGAVAAWDAAGAAAVAAARAAAWDAAGAAAEAAAEGAAGAAAVAAAGVAARAAAWDSAWVEVRDSAVVAVRVAAWDAAWAAAWDAARERLRPTVERLQADAVVLLRDLCATAKEMRAA